MRKSISAQCDLSAARNERLTVETRRITFPRHTSTTVSPQYIAYGQQLNFEISRLFLFRIPLIYGRDLRLFSCIYVRILLTNSDANKGKPDYLETLAKSRRLCLHLMHFKLPCCALCIILFFFPCKLIKYVKRFYFVYVSLRSFLLYLRNLLNFNDYSSECLRRFHCFKSFDSPSFRNGIKLHNRNGSQLFRI